MRTPAVTGTRRSFLAGVLIGNSVPHLASAVADRRHLTPLAGRRSSPRVNLLWALANLAGGSVLLRRANPDDTADQRWDGRLLAFEAGAGAAAIWMLVSESLARVNRSPAR